MSVCNYHVITSLAVWVFRHLHIVFDFSSWFPSEKH